MRYKVLRDPLPREYDGERPFTAGDTVELKGASIDRWLRRGVIEPVTEQKRGTKAAARTDD